MGKVSGTIPFQSEEDSKPEQVPFGEWLLGTIVKNAEDNGWACKREGNNLYVWFGYLEEPGKDKQHFRDKEHLHLIDKGTDVAISTKHPQALTLDRGVHVKRTQEEKTPEHLTGTRAVNRGESEEINICNKTVPPDGVVDWQKELIGDLRDLTKQWLRGAGSEAQTSEFLA